MKAEIQLNKWHSKQLYNTCLKFIDFLKEHHIKGLEQNEYNVLLAQKVLLNFHQKKQYLVAKDTITRYLISLPVVISLFGFLLPKYYRDILEGAFFEDFENDVTVLKPRQLKIWKKYGRENAEEFCADSKFSIDFLC